MDSISRIPPIRAAGIKQLGMTEDGKYLMRGGKDHQVYAVTPVNVPAAEDIIAIREKKGMTRKQFARTLGVSAAVLSSWENGKKQPTGVSCRLLDMIERDGSLLQEYIDK